MRDQRFVFGEAAASYDRLRPSFPADLVADLVRVAALEETSHILEVGAGTGKMTTLLAPTGATILAVEPTAGMAALLERNTARLPGVSIAAETFEAVEVAPASFDLVVAAQSWHWVDEDVRLVKAGEVLRAGATIALVWNVADVEAYAFHDEIDAVYRTHAPHLAHGSTTTGWQPEDDPTASLEASPAFVDVHRLEYRWSRRLATSDYLELLGTHSHHRMLEPEVRTRLADEIGAIVDAHGGEIEECYVARSFVATRV